LGTLKASIPILIVPETVNAPDASGKTPTNLDVGILGETLVAEWHQSQGGIVLQRRWTCRSGELDLIVKTATATLIFIEVKTRSRGNWDHDGLLAITPRKREKLITAAQLFLVKHPHLSELPCRFDVALVHCQKIPKGRNQPNRDNFPPHPTKLASCYQFTLQTYIQNAFD
jgi:putative endonuclease